jgi:hypothetical protein
LDFGCAIDQDGRFVAHLLKVAVFPKRTGQQKLNGAHGSQEGGTWFKREKGTILNPKPGNELTTDFTDDTD